MEEGMLSGMRYCQEMDMMEVLTGLHFQYIKSLHCSSNLHNVMCQLYLNNIGGRGRINLAFQSYPEIDMCLGL